MKRLMRVLGTRESITTAVEVAGLVAVVVSIGMLTSVAWAVLAGGVLAVAGGYWASR